MWCCWAVSLQTHGAISNPAHLILTWTAGQSVVLLPSSFVPHFLPDPLLSSFFLFSSFCPPSFRRWRLGYLCFARGRQVRLRSRLIGPLLAGSAGIGSLNLNHTFTGVGDLSVWEHWQVNIKYMYKANNMQIKSKLHTQKIIQNVCKYYKTRSIQNKYTYIQLKCLWQKHHLIPIRVWF